MKNILFVCTGNTCRSPMAQALFNELVKKTGHDSEFRADSAGLYVSSTSDKPAINSIKTMQEAFGIDISEYKPKNISKELLETVDLVLCMEQSMSSLLKSLNINDIEIDSLGNYCGVNQDVLDPYGGNEKTYLECANNIKGLIEKLMDKIIKNEEENK